MTDRLGERPARDDGTAPGRYSQAELEELYREGLDIVSLTQWQLIRRKFLADRKSVV